tara:strand:+ start:596 stop:1759 length:1164 start_codon:yes stop_codon:yes gene_type:complete
MYKTIKTMRQALEEARSYRDPIKEDKGFSTQQIKMAYGILNDPRYKQGNYSGAVSAIEKIAKGLSDHPDVANALKRANESLEEETITEFKKMIVTIKDPIKRANAMKDIERFGKGTGFRIDKMGDEFRSFRIDGNGADLNKFATDMKNFYGATIKAESLEEAVFDSDAMQTIKLKNGTKVLDKIYTDRTQADNAASSLMKQHKGAKADAYYNLVNKKFYVRIKELPSSFKEETITEFKKMTVTFKDMDSFAKAYVDLAKKGFKLQGQGLEIKVDGNGADLNKYAADMNNFYGATVKAESLGEAAAGSPSMRISKQDADKFDMAKYKENEKENQHSDNALLLVKKFGTAADYKKIVDIDIRHQKAGHISMADLKTRNDISRKYIGRLI